MGKTNLKAYFRRGLEAYPELHFRLDDVLLGVSSIVLLYTNQKGTHTTEFMEIVGSWKSCSSCRELQCSRRSDLAHALVLIAEKTVLSYIHPSS